MLICKVVLIFLGESNLDEEQKKAVNMEVLRLNAIEMIHCLLYSHWCKLTGFRMLQTGTLQVVANKVWSSIPINSSSM